MPMMRDGGCKTAIELLPRALSGCSARRKINLPPFDVGASGGQFFSRRVSRGAEVCRIFLPSARASGYHRVLCLDRHPSRMDNSQLTRINKYLSEAGFCSRRAADKLIEEGRVRINDKVAEIGSKVAPGDVVKVNGKAIANDQVERVCIAFHKPVGIVCTTDTGVEPDNIIDFINYPTRIFPIGRLDKPSEGLIFLTNDGDIVNKILRARNNHEKEYVVTVDRPITEAFLRSMRGGIPILGTVTRECRVEKMSRFVFRIVLTQGLNRQIRRMCDYLEYRVTRLKRVRIMNIRLDVPVGTWRHLTADELAEIHRASAHSAKTHDASDLEDENE
jgi:23S rRNA pseudouridine2604 synthase